METVLESYCGGPSSTAMTRVAWLSAALEAPYATWFSSPKNACIELMFTTTPFPPAIIAGACAEWNKQQGG